MKRSVEAMQHPSPFTTNTTEPPDSQGKAASTGERPTEVDVRTPGMSVQPALMEEDEWSNTIRLAPTGLEQAQEPHQEPHLLERATIGGTGVIPVIQAELPAPAAAPAAECGITLKLKTIPEGERAQALQEVFAVHPAATSITLLSALPADVFSLCSNAGLCAGLRHIDVKFTSTTIYDGFEHQLAEALLKIPDLTSVKLDVDRCRSKYSKLVHTHEILRGLAASTRLESIELKGGWLSTDGIRCAFGAMSKCKVHTLTISDFDNQGGADDDDEGAVETLLRCAGNNLSLKNLSLTKYSEGVDTTKAMAYLLEKNQTLKSLDAVLELCNSRKARILGDALASNSSVKSLKLAIDFSHDDSYREFASVMTNPSPETLPYASVARGLARNQTLQQVKFSFAVIESGLEPLAPHEVRLLIRAIGQHPCITVAELDFSRFCTIEYVLPLLQNSPRLRTLKVVDDLPSPEIYEQIAQAIEKHPSLQTFEWRLPDGRDLADSAATKWKIINAREVFKRTELRIALALAQNQGAELGANLNDMMEARVPTPGMTETPPLDISRLIMTHAMLVLPDEDKQNVIDAFRM